MRFRSILQGDFDKSPWVTPVPIALYNGNRQDTGGNCDMDAGENEIRLEKPATALRRGWTTGACATAATKAALTALLTGEFPDPVDHHPAQEARPELCACPRNPRRRSCNGRHRQGCR
jgi:hypothetical protein